MNHTESLKQPTSFDQDDGPEAASALDMTEAMLDGDVLNWGDTLFALLASDRCPPQIQSKCADALEVLHEAAKGLAQTKAERVACDMLEDYIANNLGDDGSELEEGRGITR